MTSAARPALGIAQLLLAAAVAIAILAGLPTRTLPVEATFPGGTVPVATVHLGWALVALSLWSAAARLISARWLRLAEYSQVAGVTVFLVAQLNGIRGVVALVPLFAISAAATLFLDLMRRDRERGDTGRVPFVLGAAVAVVPWGVIAFAQIGSLVVPPAIDPVARTATVALLLLAATHWFLCWRGAWGTAVTTLLSGLVLAVTAFVG